MNCKCGHDHLKHNPSDGICYHKENERYCSCAEFTFPTCVNCGSITSNCDCLNEHKLRETLHTAETALGLHGEDRVSMYDILSAHALGVKLVNRRTL